MATLTLHLSLLEQFSRLLLLPSFSTTDWLQIRVQLQDYQVGCFFDISLPYHIARFPDPLPVQVGGKALSNQEVYGRKIVEAKASGNQCASHSSSNC